MPFEDVRVRRGIPFEETLHIVGRNACVSIEEHDRGVSGSIEADTHRRTCIAQVDSNLLVR